MSTAPVKSLIDDRLEEVAGTDPADVIEKAKRIHGIIGWPCKAYKEPGGPWVHRYDIRPRASL